MSLLDKLHKEHAQGVHEELVGGNRPVYDGRPGGMVRRAAPEVARARTSDPVTSHEAAVTVTGHGVLRPRPQAVLDCLAAMGGTATDWALGERYEQLRAERDWPAQSPSGLRTRRKELVRAGQVTARGYARLPTGRRAQVWALTRGL